MQVLRIRFRRASFGGNRRLGIRYISKMGLSRVTIPCLVLMFLTLLSITLPVSTQNLTVGFYNDKCPTAETVVSGVVKAKYNLDKTIIPGLLRLYFHDCFVNGCDASVLLNTSSSTNEEKDSLPNQTLHGIDVIDLAKSKLEKVCAGKVSCADIIALATRDAVALAGGKHYEVPCGRWDGIVSLKSAADAELPAPTSSVASAAKLFATKGLNISDMVVLLVGGHSYGKTHCVFCRDRLYNFGGTGGGPDPSMNKTTLARLSKTCKNDNQPLGPTVDLDGVTPNTIDNVYCKGLVSHNGVFDIDQALTSDTAANAVVNSLARDSNLFDTQYPAALVKLGNIPGTTTPPGGRIVRTLCKENNLVKI